MDVALITAQHPHPCISLLCLLLYLVVLAAASSSSEAEQTGLPLDVSQGSCER